MKISKISLNFLLAVTIMFSSLSVKTLAQEITTAEADDDLIERIEYIGFDKNENIDSKKDIEKMFKTIDKAMNRKNIKKISKYYSEDFINTDGENRETILKVIKDNFETFKKIKSTTTVNSIRVHNNYITVHASEKFMAETAQPEESVKDTGVLNAETDVYYFLKRTGARDWKIIGEEIVAENYKIGFGLGKSISSTLDAPEKIKAGTDYSAKLTSRIPEGYLVAATIKAQEIEYPNKMDWDVFKMIKFQDGTLERYFNANQNNRNEYVYGLIGYSHVMPAGQGADKLKLEGLTYLASRVNIISAKPAKNNKEVPQNDNKKASMR